MLGQTAPFLQAIEQLIEHADDVTERCQAPLLACVIRSAVSRFRNSRIYGTTRAILSRFAGDVDRCIIVSSSTATICGSSTSTVICGAHLLTLGRQGREPPKYRPGLGVLTLFLVGAARAHHAPPSVKTKLEVRPHLPPMDPSASSAEVLIAHVATKAEPVNPAFYGSTVIYEPTQPLGSESA